MMVKYIRNALAQTYYMLLLYLLALLKTFKKAIRKKLLVYRHSTHPLWNLNTQKVLLAHIT